MEQMMINRRGSGWQEGRGGEKEGKFITLFWSFMLFNPPGREGIVLLLMSHSRFRKRATGWRKFEQTRSEKNPTHGLIRATGWNWRAESRRIHSPFSSTLRRNREEEVIFCLRILWEIWRGFRAIESAHRHIPRKLFLSFVLYRVSRTGCTPTLRINIYWHFTEEFLFIVSRALS